MSELLDVLAPCLVPQAQQYARIRDFKASPWCGPGYPGTWIVTARIDGQYVAGRVRDKAAAS